MTILTGFLRLARLRDGRNSQRYILHSQRRRAPRRHRGQRRGQDHAVQHPHRPPAARPRQRDLCARAQKRSCSPRSRRRTSAAGRCWTGRWTPFPACTRPSAGWPNWSAGWPTGTVPTRRATPRWRRNSAARAATNTRPKRARCSSASAFRRQTSTSGRPAQRRPENAAGAFVSARFGHRRPSARRADQPSRP